jgi:hypothetical protein
MVVLQDAVLIVVNGSDYKAIVRGNSGSRQVCGGKKSGKARSRSATFQTAALGFALYWRSAVS